MSIYGHDAGQFWPWCRPLRPHNAQAPPVSIKGPGPAPGSQPTKFHLLTGWLAQPRWYPCSEHLGQFHPAPWPDTDAAAAGADAAAGEEDVTEEGGDALGGGGGEVKRVPIWVQTPL